MSVSLNDLQLLLDVADCGSFSQAAARRGWSQPQVSQRISLLEHTLGQDLFARHRRGALPTPACLKFLESARQAVAAFEQGRALLDGSPLLPRITLSCLPSLTASIYGPLMVKLADAPMEIRCSADHSHGVMTALLSGEIQVGFVLKCPAVAGIRMERLWCSPIIAVVSPRHPLALVPNPLKLSELANQRIAPQFWGEDCETLIQLIRQHREQALPIHAVQPTSAIMELVLRHQFVSFVPRIVVHTELQEGRLREIPLTDLPHWQWEVMMAWRSGKRRDPAKESVLKAARQVAQEMSSASKGGVESKPDSKRGKPRR